MIDRASHDDAFFQLMQIRDGAIVYHALCVAAKLQLADHIERGLQTTAELANELGADEDAVYRVLRALASRGIFEETTAQRFENTAFSRRLMSGVPGSVRPAVLFFGTEYFSRSLANMEHSVVTGEPVAKNLFGMENWEYMRHNPDLAATFDDAMTNLTGMQTPSIVEAYDFGQWGSITDVGGGNGILLAQLLRANPDLRGVLADQAHVLKRAAERDLFRDVAPRIRLAECDFFKKVPADSRACLMKFIMHDWTDAESRAILDRCREAVPSDGALLLIEWDIPEANTPSVGKMTDLMMLVLNGGKERTRAQFSKLLESAGFRLNRVIPTRVGLNVLEALPI